MDSLDKCSSKTAPVLNRHILLRINHYVAEIVVSRSKKESTGCSNEPPCEKGVKGFVDGVGIEFFPHQRTVFVQRWPLPSTKLARRLSVGAAHATRGRRWDSVENRGVKPLLRESRISRERSMVGLLVPKQPNCGWRGRRLTRDSQPYHGIGKTLLRATYLFARIAQPRRIPGF